MAVNGVTLLIWVIIFIHSLKFSSSTDCYEQADIAEEMTYNPDSIIDDYHYDELPQQLSTKTVGIHLRCHGVEFPIPAIELQNKCDLECPLSLVMKHSNSSVIIPDAFAKIPTLTSITMDNQQIEELQQGAFRSLDRLQHINLTGNRLTKIDSGIFGSLSQLTILDLSWNNISVLEKNSFAGMRSLQVLNISHNNLIVMGDSIFKTNIFPLSILDLSFNKISNFDPLSINVKELDLNGNMIDTMNFCHILGLIRLNLSNNRIRSLLNNNCSYEVSSIEILDLSYNNLSELDSVAFFKSPNNLRTLELNNNNISIIPTGFFSTLHSLTYLNLSHNEIEGFQHGNFEALGELQILDVSHNNLKDIKRYFHALSSLKVLHINQNEIVSLNSEQLNDLPKLVRITMEDNNMTCDNLIDLIQELGERKISFDYGSTKHNSNIQGISCFENIYSEKTVTNNQDFKKNSMYAYFNDDFKESSFYKYMENMQKSNSINFNKTHMFKYLDENFEHTKFFKYLESLKGMENVVDNFNNSVNNLIDQEYEKTEIMNSVMYKFFNENFEQSKFYKYLESLQNTPYDEVIHQQKLIKEPSETVSYNDRIIPLFILMILVIICINTLLSTYLKFNNSKKSSRVSEA